MLYSIRASAFAAVICGLWMLICWLRRRRLCRRTLIYIIYFSALVEITVIRGSVDVAKILQGGRALPQLHPLHTTLAEIHRGLWPMTFHIVGNLIWFIPLGLLCSNRRFYMAALWGVVVSVSIESLQYVLMSGVTDVDDVLLNTLGAILGWSIGRVFQGRKSEEVSTSGDD